MQADLPQSGCFGDSHDVTRPHLSPVWDQQVSELVEVVPSLFPKLAVQPQ